MVFRCVHTTPIIVHYLSPTNSFDFWSRLKRAQLSRFLITVKHSHSPTKSLSIFYNRYIKSGLEDVAHMHYGREMSMLCGSCSPKIISSLSMETLVRKRLISRRAGGQAESVKKLCLIFFFCVLKKCIIVYITSFGSL